MTELERAVQWLEDIIKWHHHTAEAADHCRVLLDALRENARLNQTIQSLTGALDEVTATAKHHEAENERLKADMKQIRCLCFKADAKQFYGRPIQDILAITDKEGERHEIACDRCIDCSNCANNGRLFCYQDCDDSEGAKRSGLVAYKHFKAKYKHCPECGHAMPEAPKEG